MSKPTYKELEQRIRELEQTEIRHKKSEKAMQQYKRAVESSLDLMVEFDKNYTYQFANKGYLKYHQLNEKQIIGNSFGEVIGEDYFENKIKPYFDRCLNGETINFETAYSYRGKGKCHMEVWYFPLIKEDGKIHGVVALSRDITDRKQAEEALRESEKQYRMLIHRIQAAVVVHNADTKIIASNPKAQELLGLTEDQMLGKTAIDKDWKFFDAYGKEMPLEEYPVNRVLATQQPLRDFTAGIRRSKKNDLVWVLINANPVLDDKGGIQQVIVTFMDITERRQNEELLKQYKSAVEGSLDLIAAVDRDYTYLLANKSYLEHHQLKEKQVIGHYFGEVVGKDYFENNLKPHMDRCLAGETLHFETDYTYKEKGKCYMEAWYYPLKDEDGKVQGVVGIARDITERKRAEEMLRLSEMNYRSIFNAVNDAIAVHDMETGLFLDVNEKFCQLSGYTRDEACKLTIADLGSSEPPFTQEGTLEFISKAAKGDPQIFEWMAKDSSGRLFWTEVNLKRATIKGQDSLLAVIRDISDRKREEEKLQESELKFKLVTETIKDVFWMSTCGVGKMVYISPAYDILWERSREDLYQSPKSFLEAIHPDDLNGYLGVMDEYHKNGKPYDCEYRIIRRNGEVRWIQEKGFPVSQLLGGPKLMTGVCTDITDRKQAEEEKIKALEFAAEQSKHALIGQVAGKMAHDFNNVLMGIMGNAQLATMDCDNEEIKVRLENIHEFALRGRDITSNLMSYSKDQEPKQTYFKIEDKIELVLKMLEKDMSGIKISRNYKPGISQLLADPGMIQDALVNIIQNSIHAMSKVKNPTLNLKVYPQDDKVYIEVADNGCGISKEHLDSIYTPSFTLKVSYDETGSYESGIKGTGYGMSNVKKYIAEKHKGDIFLESQVGKGTKITIALRIIKDHLSSDEKKEVVKSQIYDKRRILLVEDEPAIADVQYQILTKEPFSHIVSIAANGQTAIDIFGRNKFDVVSLDYMLPGNINGLDVYNHIRENDKDIPVMFISGNIEFLESMKKLKEKDPNLEYISKPIDNLDYVNKINELVGSST